MLANILDDGESRERFKRRLEAFSDIVFGLSLSQLALQLSLPDRASELVDHPLRYFIFFGTFAVICLTWLSHHRMFQLAFEPEPLDIGLNFVYLAFVAILPFAMQVNIRFGGSTIGLGFYIVDFAAGSLPMLLLLERGLARRNPKLSVRQRLELWRATLRNRAVLAASLLSLALLALAGPEFAWVPLALLAVVARIVRRTVNSVPARYLPLDAPVSATPPA
jgi:uncharacterized membrane protein